MEPLGRYTMTRYDGELNCVRSHEQRTGLHSNCPLTIALTDELLVLAASIGDVMQTDEGGGFVCLLSLLHSQDLQQRQHPSHFQKLCHELVTDKDNNDMSCMKPLPLPIGL